MKLDAVLSTLTLAQIKEILAGRIPSPTRASWDQKLPGSTAREAVRGDREGVDAAGLRGQGRHVPEARELPTTTTQKNWLFR